MRANTRRWFSHYNAVRFVSAPCSTGKTHAACAFIASHLLDSNHLYVAPSIRLLKQTETMLSDLGLKAAVITSETYPWHAKSEIMKFLKTARSRGAVLLITRQA